MYQREGHRRCARRGRTDSRKYHHFRSVCERLEPRSLLTAVVGYHDDQASTGQNLSETLLTPADVNAQQFGKLAVTPVDGQVYAQPLYLPGVDVTAGAEPGVHNVVYVSTEHDSLYAIDGTTGDILWQDSFLLPEPGLAGQSVTVTPVPEAQVISYGVNIGPEIGITSTPVIDPAAGELYLTASTKQVVNGDTAHPHFAYSIYRVDVHDGSYSQSVMGDTVYSPEGAFTYRLDQDPYVLGTGDGSIAVDGQPRVYFNAMREMNRPALTLANGVVYVAFASHGDLDPYHGWVLGYNENSLALSAVFNATPDGSEGGIWQSGGQIAVDPQGYLYLETGNGTFDTTFDAQGFPVNGDYGDAFLKLAADPTTTQHNPNINGWGLKVVDYFTPFNELVLQSVDWDLGSGGPMVLPDSAGSAAHPHLLLGAGKQGVLYLIDRDNMGKFDPATDHVVQEVPGAISASFDTPAYFDGSVYYVGGWGGNAETFSISDGTLSTQPTSVSPDPASFPGSTPSISADGNSDGIVWDINYGSAELRAYAASGYGDELYTSDQAGVRDALGPAVKFTVPTVADGHVYVGAQAALVTYGRIVDLARPSAVSGVSAQSGGARVTLQWSPSPAATGYYVYRGASPGGEDAVPVAGPLPTTTFVDMTAVAGQVYYYQVSATNAAGESARSDEAFAKSLLPDPDGDGTVDFADLLIIAQDYGSKSKVTFNDGDFNDDGVVDFSDLLLLAQYYGRTDISPPALGDLSDLSALAKRRLRTTARTL